MDSRCIHIDPQGAQCSARALTGTQFCPDHLPLVEEEPRLGGGLPLRYRLAALALLLMILWNIYEAVRASLGP
ncbi:MAG: hypothetical protein HY648_09525 [Acidobacteria bacterium]|nr:hypothetical protein [Acidobacteriota bacterium]